MNYYLSYDYSKDFYEPVKREINEIKVYNTNNVELVKGADGSDGSIWLSTGELKGCSTFNNKTYLANDFLTDEDYNNGSRAVFLYPHKGYLYDFENRYLDDLDGTVIDYLHGKDGVKLPVVRIKEFAKHTIDQDQFHKIWHAQTEKLITTKER